jgi:hypothetical protein
VSSTNLENHPERRLTIVRAAPAHVGPLASSWASASPSGLVTPGFARGGQASWIAGRTANTKSGTWCVRAPSRMRPRPAPRPAAAARRRDPSRRRTAWRRRRRSPASRRGAARRRRAADRRSGPGPRRPLRSAGRDDRAGPQPVPARLGRIFPLRALRPSLRPAQQLRDSPTRAVRVQTPQTRARLRPPGRRRLVAEPSGADHRPRNRRLTQGQHGLAGQADAAGERRR